MMNVMEIALNGNCALFFFFFLNQKSHSFAALT